MASKLRRPADTLDMTEGGIVSKVVLFAIPLLIGNLFQQLYNMVDSIVVGNFCAHTALSAVGTAGIPMQILMALFLGIGTGATILVSQFKGAGDPDSIRRTIRTGNAFLMLASAPVTLLGLVISPFVLRMMNVPDDVMAEANIYLRIVFVGTLPSLGYNMNAGILRGVGDSRSPLKFLMLSCLVNIVLDLLFVIVFGWGVAGVAIATVAAQFVSWIYSILYIKKHYPDMALRVFDLTIDRGLLRHMIRLGLPLGFNNAIFALGFLFLNGLVNRQGSIFMAGVTAASRVDNLIFLPITSFAAAATTFSGQNVGAGRFDRLKSGFWRILGVTLASNVVFSGIILLFGRYVLMIFTQDADIIEVGMNCIFWIAPWYWLYNIFAICNNYMNGVGEVRIPTLASLFMFWGVRLPAAYLLFAWLGKFYIYAAYPISWAAGALLSGGYFLSGHWRRHYLSRAGQVAPDKDNLPPELPRLHETRVYFVRHAEADRTQGDDKTHPLTRRGMMDSQKVSALLDSAKVGRLFSSPMNRAVMTLMDMAVRRGLNIEILDDFRERAVGDAPPPDFEDFARRQWEDFDYALPGGESLRQAQQRAVSALADVLLRCDGQTVAIGCHGASLCALIHYYDPAFGYAAYREAAPKMPWIVRMTFKEGHFDSMAFVDLP